jgi:hypothetical protein
MVATRVGAIIDRTTGFFEGVLVWVVSLILMAYLAGSGLGSIASGAFTMLGGATQTVGAVAQGQAGVANVDGSGAIVDVSGTIDEMAERLRSPEFVNQVASTTGLSVNETRTVLNETATRVEANRNNPPQAAEEARRGIAALFDRARASGALAAQPEDVQPEAAAASAAWLTFIALLLSLGAAVAGAMFGRSKAADAVAGVS